MPFAELKLTPSVNIEPTQADNQSGVSFSNFIRWRANLPEKRGGCTLYINQQVGGVPVSLKPWADIQGDSFLGIATPNNVTRYNVKTTELRDISPQYFISSLASPTFTTTVGSTTINITDSTQPGVQQGDSVQFITPIYVGGIILNGTYPILAPASSNTYQITAPYPATIAVSGVTPGPVSGGSNVYIPQFLSISGTSQIQVDFPIQYQYDSLAVGDLVGFFGDYATPTQPLTTVGGVPIIGSFVVTQISTSTEFLFNANYTATSTQSVAMNNGYTYLVYWIAQQPGPPP